MASVGVTLLRSHTSTKLFNLFKSSNVGVLMRHNAGALCNIGVIRHYSVFPTHYKKPVFRKDAQAVLEMTGEIEEFAHTSFRPPEDCETCSVFFDPLVNKFINYLMRKGNKQLARQLVETAFTKIKRIQLEKYHKASPDKRHEIELDPVKILYRAVEHCKPVMELLPIRKGGATYQVPVPILEKRQSFLACNWILKIANEKEATIRYTTVLAKEIVDAADNTGRVVKKKQDLHKQCEANRAYAHFRWT